MDIDVAALIELLNAHKWVALAALVIGAVVRLLKSDTPIPIDIPSRWRPVVALGLGVVSGVLEALATGKPWLEAVIGGFVSAFAAMSGHAVLVDALRGGRDVGVKKGEIVTSSAAVSVRPPPGLGVLMLALAVALAPLSCAGVQIVPILETVIQAASLASSAIASIEQFEADYFTLFPDPAREAEITKHLERAKATAAALAALSRTGVDVDQGKFVAALEDFRAAYADLLRAIEGLPSATLAHAATDRKAVASKGRLVCVAPPVSAFGPGGAK